MLSYFCLLDVNLSKKQRKKHAFDKLKKVIRTNNIRKMPDVDVDEIEQQSVRAGSGSRKRTRGRKTKLKLTPKPENDQVKSGGENDGVAAKKRQRVAKTKACDTLSEMADRGDIEPLNVTSGSVTAEDRFNAFMSKYIGNPMMGGRSGTGARNKICFSSGSGSGNARPGMDVTMLLLSIEYRERRSENGPNGPVMVGLVLENSISFRGAGYGKLTGRLDGNEGAIVRHIRRPTTAAEREARNADGKKAQKYAYDKADEVVIRGGSTILAVDIFAESDALGSKGQHFKSGDVIECRGIHLETRSIDPIERPDGYTSYSAHKACDASPEKRAGVDSDALFKLKPSNVVHFRPSKVPDKWASVEKRLSEEGMDMDMRTATSLMRKAMDSRTRQMLSGEILMTTENTPTSDVELFGRAVVGYGDDGSKMDLDSDNDNSAGDSRVLSVYSRMMFPSDTDSEMWRRTKDNKDMPYVQAMQQKDQFDPKTGRLTVVHMNLSVPTKYVASFGIADPRIAIGVLPVLVPSMQTVFYGFVDVRNTIYASENALGSGVPCVACARRYGTDVHNGGVYECSSWSYVAKNVFPNFKMSLDRAARDPENQRVFQVDLKYARQHLKSVHKTSNMAASQYAQMWAKNNPLNSVGFAGDANGQPVINVAESMKDYGQQAMLQWTNYNFYAVYGFEYRQRDIQEIAAAELHLKTPQETGDFLHSAMAYDSQRLQVIFAVKRDAPESKTEQE